MDVKVWHRSCAPGGFQGKGEVKAAQRRRGEGGATSLDVWISRVCHKPQQLANWVSAQRDWRWELAASLPAISLNKVSRSWRLTPSARIKARVPESARISPSVGSYFCQFIVCIPVVLLDVLMIRVLRSPKDRLAGNGLGAFHAVRHRCLHCFRPIGVLLVVCRHKGH
jgi:hypothetical protein